MGVLKDQIRVRVREKQRRKETSLPTQQAVESIIMQHLEENNPSEDFEVDLEELLSTETLINLKKYAKLLDIKVKGTSKASVVTALYQGANSDENKISVLMNCMNKSRSKNHTFAMVNDDSEQTTLQ